MNLIQRLFTVPLISVATLCITNIAHADKDDFAYQQSSGLSTLHNGLSDIVPLVVKIPPLKGANFAAAHATNFDGRINGKSSQRRIPTRTTRPNEPSIEPIHRDYSRSRPMRNSPIPPIRESRSASHQNPGSTTLVSAMDRWYMKLSWGKNNTGSR